jgi:hypothetical protein
MAAWGLLALLLALDLALVVCHIRLSPRQGSWNLEADNGYPEKLQYVKWLGGCLLLLTLALRRHAAIYFGWAAICLYFLLDDAALLHEWIGERLAIGLGLGRIHRIYLAWVPRLLPQAAGFRRVDRGAHRRRGHRRAARPFVARARRRSGAGGR